MVRHLFFSPITPTRGKDAKMVNDINARLHAKYGIDLFPTLCIAGFEMHWTLMEHWLREGTASGLRNIERKGGSCLRAMIVIAPSSATKAKLESSYITSSKLHHVPFPLREIHVFILSIFHYVGV